MIQHEVEGLACAWFSPQLAAQAAALQADWLHAALYRPTTAPGLALSVLRPDRSGAIWLRLRQHDRFDGAAHAAADELPFCDGAFSVVLLQHVHEFCANPARLIADCVRLLQPGGRLLISGFNPCAWSRWRHWRPAMTERPRLHMSGRLNWQLQDLGLSCAPIQYLRWPQSSLERCIAVRQLHGVYLLEASKRPPDFLTLRSLRMPAGAVPG
jgi:SAM-dependent methyltransferase